MRAVSVGLLAVVCTATASSDVTTSIDRLARQDETSTTCESGLHIIVARGTDESRGSGRMGSIASGIQMKLPDTTVDAVDYPASEDFYPSAAEGVTALTTMLQSYHEECPRGRVALLGLSQGAEVVMDSLCGKYLGPLYNVTAPLEDEVARNIIAVVVFDDPSHVPGLPWNVGTGKRKGWFPRWNVSSCTSFFSKTKSWCLEGSRFCDNGILGNSADDIYFELYTDDAVDFVVSQFHQVSNLSMGNGSSGSYPHGATTHGGQPCSAPISSNVNRMAIESMVLVNSFLALAVAAATVAWLPT